LLYFVFLESVTQFPNCYFVLFTFRSFPMSAESHIAFPCFQPRR